MSYLFIYLDSLCAASEEKLLHKSLHNIRISETIKIQIEATNLVKWVGCHDDSQQTQTQVVYFIKFKQNNVTQLFKSF